MHFRFGVDAWRTRHKDTGKFATISRDIRGFGQRKLKTYLPSFALPNNE